MAFTSETITTTTGDVTLLFTQAAYSFTATGSAYYLSPTGSDGAAGTLAAPWATFAHAAGLLNPGDCLFVRAGDHAGPWVFARSGTQTQPIVIAAYPGESPRIVMPDAQDGSVFRLDGCHYVTVHGLEILGNRGQAGAPAPDHFLQNGITLRAGAGLGVKILNCRSHRCLHCGIKEMGDGGTGFLLEGNLIFDNGSAQFGDHGLYLPASNIIVRGNVCFRNAGWGIHSYASPTGQAIYNNVCFENGADGFVQAGANNLHAHNICHANTRGGFCLYRAGCQGNQFLNNLSYNNTDKAVIWDQNGGANSYPSGNNIDWNTMLPSIWYDNSLLLAQAGTHNLLTDPLVADEANHDYRLTATSPGKGELQTVALPGCVGIPTDPGIFDADLYAGTTPATTAHYLSPSGSDLAAGTLAAPWRTLAHAQTLMAPGHTLYLRGGTYDEIVVWTLSGTAALPVVITAYPGEVPVLTTLSTAVQKNQLTILTLKGAQYVTLHGLSIEGSRARIVTSVAGARKQYCLELTTAGGHGVKILACRLYHGLAGGMQDNLNADSWRMEGSLIYNNGLNANDPALRVQGRAMILRGNGIFSNTGTGIQAVTTTSGRPDAPQVYSNLMFANGGHGISMSGTNGRFGHNVCHANTLRGFQFVQQYVTGNQVLNSMLWANLQNQVGADTNCPATGNSVDACLIAPSAAPYWYQNAIARGYDGGHNVFSVPQVNDAAHHDYRLATGAAGDDAARAITLNGLARLWPDIGLVPATEYTEPTL